MHRTGKPQHQPEPAHAAHPLMREMGRDESDEDRLQADDDGDRARRGAGFEREIAKAEIDGLDEEADDRHMAPVARRVRAAAAA